MSRSLGEVSALAQKAARGCGYDWGIADEAGFAVCWLEMRGLGGCAALAALLRILDGTDLSEAAPQNLNEPSSPSGTLCPIQTGAALSDACPHIGPSGLSLPAVHAPVLLFGFLAHLSRETDVTLSITAGDGFARLNGTPEGGFEIGGHWITAPQAVSITETSGTVAPAMCQTRAEPDPDDWRILNRFAKRTYAPATEASRLAGAGAGLTDND